MSKSPLKKENLKKKKIKGKEAIRHTIMIVDDEPNHRSSLASLLEEDYKIICASDGDEAIKIISQMKSPQHISLIIGDQIMPNVTGIEMFKIIKDMIPNTIRILLTAHGQKNVLVQAINDAKIYEFIEKPFEPEGLLLRVKRALDFFDQQRNLEKSYATISKLLSHITCDLGDQMGVLSLAADMLRNNFDSSSDETMKKYIDKVINRKDHLSYVMNSTLSWANSQKDGIKSFPNTINIAELVTNIIELFSDNARDKGIVFESKISSSTVAYADLKMIAFVFRSLISNGLKFTAPGGWVRVNEERNENQVKISVSDNGMGIKPELLSGIFKENPNNDGAHSLSICYDFVERNKGEITVTSELGKGTCFSVTLPTKEWKEGE